jgi:trigger factor
MQVTETASEGLKRQLRVVVGAGELSEKFQARLNELKGQVQLKGFRRGKVPVTHLKKVFGRSVMAEILQEAVDETSRKALNERNERPAMQPKIELPEDTTQIERVIAGESDLAYDMSFEILPEVSVTDLPALKLERLVADVDDAAIDKALRDLAERNVSYAAEDGREARDGDRITMDFTGKIEGEPFEGGSGEDVQLVLGKSQFIPGFEDGLKGVKPGEERTVQATFPAEYPVANLAGKTAQFDVTVKGVAQPVVPEIDDEFAKGLGAESLARLRDMVAAQIRREYDQVSRSKLKRALFDELDKTHDFALPPALVEGEFEAIWNQVKADLEQRGKTLAEEGKDEAAERERYRKIAERRVRLGLLIGEIGEKNKIHVNQEELKRALADQARRFPGREKMVYEYYQKNPAALTELRAPVLEEKVVDFIFELAKPAERKVSAEELLKPEEDAD